MPRWVKVSGLIVVVAIALVLLVVLLTGGDGGHGPGRHLPDSRDAGAGRGPELAPEAVSVHG